MIKRIRRAWRYLQRLASALTGGPAPPHDPTDQH